VLQNITSLDAGIACWDSKYAYWPSVHSSSTRTSAAFLNTEPSKLPSRASLPFDRAAAILGYLFPRDATTLAALAEEANESRIWAGIHYHSDTVAGAALGRAIAGKVIDRARRDGSQERYRIGPGETRAVRVSGLT
jgi:membrane-associated phospholipid phosphatase